MALLRKQSGGRGYRGSAWGNLQRICALSAEIGFEDIQSITGSTLSKTKEQFMPESEKALMHETGRSGLVHWEDPEGWDGEGGGRGDRDGEHM